MIIIIFGLPGSGKTYFARALSKHMQVPHVNTDQVRNDVKKKGQYSEKTKTEIYHELLKNVSSILDHQEVVIVDATFSKKRNRVLFQNLAVNRDTILKLIEIVADEDCIRERLKKPRRDSEADFHIYKKIKAEFEAIDMDHIVLRSDKMSIDEMIQKTLSFLSLTPNYEC